MRNTRSTAGGTAAGTPRSRNAVEDYLERVPQPARATLEKVRAVIRSAAPPEATESLYYQMPAFHYKGSLVAYAAFKEHCSLFPLSAALIEELAEQLRGYPTSKGTIRFPLDKPLPAALIRKIVRARVAAREQRARGLRPAARRSTD